MDRCLLLHVFLFIPLINGNNTTNGKIDEVHKIDSNKTNEIFSKSGSILPKLIPLPTLKKNDTNLMTLEKEIEVPKVKSVVPRKGVVYNAEEESVVNAHKDRIDTTIAKVVTSMENKDVGYISSSTTHLLPLLDESAQTNQDAVHNVSSTSTKVPKKPLVLSYEALSETQKNLQNDHSVLPKVSTSVETELADQPPTPIKAHIVSSSRHPGMIMPVVLTMLVVPMFAVLGYLAVRKGQEAWKNRHYKRMDFLLDGMYND